MRIYQIEKREESKQARQASDEIRREYEKKCLSCGACCSYYAWFPKRIYAEDGELANDPHYTFKARERVKWVYPDGSSYTEIRESLFLRRKKVAGWWHCIALEGHVGQEVKCGVYDKRPSACRNFQPGSEMCLRAREWAGLEPEDVVV